MGNKHARIGILIALIITFPLFVDCFSLPSKPVNQLNRPLVVQTNTISIEADSYRVQIKYPFTRSKSVDSAVDKVIRQQVSRFKKDSAKPRVNPDWKYSLWIEYSAANFSKNIICFKFLIDEFTGGAHGSTTVITKVIDINTGKEYGLKDVFRSNSAYPDKLSGLCIPLLKKRLGGAADPKMISAGAGPKADNFKNFILTPTNIMIYFQRYQVGAGYLGVQEVSIPLKMLAPLLKAPFSMDNI